ncbi:MAG: hypothetical protein PHR35_04880 [Kiritimatiellae bacterium]|nr:hypothetical protein [Kiritimatiellia bacterium]
MKTILRTVIFLCLAVTLRAGVARQPDTNTLWVETFATSADATNWTTSMRLAVENGRLTVTPGDSTQRAMSRYIEWNDAYPYFQFEYAVGTLVEGYKGFYFMPFFSSNGGYFPGRWTFDLRAWFPVLPSRPPFLLRVDIHGAVLRFDYFRVVKHPEDALLVTAEPAAKTTLATGDKIRFEAILKDRAMDVTVSVLTPSAVKLGGINADGYIQLVSADNGKTWTGELTVGKGLGTTEIRPGALIFKANVLGGEIGRLYTVNPWAIKP